MSGRATHIVTGDADLIALNSYRGIDAASASILMIATLQHEGERPTFSKNQTRKGGAPREKDKVKTVVLR